MKHASFKTLLLTTLLSVNTLLPNNPQAKVEKSLKTTVYGYLQKGTDKGKQAFNWGAEKIKQIPARNLLNKAKTPFQITTYQPLFNKQTYLNNPGKTFVGVLSTTIAVLAIYHRRSAIAQWFKKSGQSLRRYFVLRTHRKCHAEAKTVFLKKCEEIATKYDINQAKNTACAVFEQKFYSEKGVETFSDIKDIENETKKLKQWVVDSKKDFDTLETGKFKDSVDEVIEEFERALENKPEKITVEDTDTEKDKKEKSNAEPVIENQEKIKDTLEKEEEIVIDADEAKNSSENDKEVNDQNEKNDSEHENSNSQKTDNKDKGNADSENKELVIEDQKETKKDVVVTNTDDKTNKETTPEVTNTDEENKTTQSKL